jgi:thioredoxin 2
MSSEINCADLQNRCLGQDWVDTEKYPELAARYNVQGIPNFAVFSHGRLQFQQAGLVDAGTMKSWLARAA